MAARNDRTGIWLRAGKWKAENAPVQPLHEGKAAQALDILANDVSSTIPARTQVSTAIDEPSV